MRKAMVSDSVDSLNERIGSPALSDTSTSNLQPLIGVFSSAEASEIRTAGHSAIPPARSRRSCHGQLERSIQSDHVLAERSTVLVGRYHGSACRQPPIVTLKCPVAG